MRPKCSRQSCVFILIASFLLLISATEAVKDLKYYKTLDISEDADEQTIKKAYRKAAM